MAAYTAKFLASYYDYWEFYYSGDFCVFYVGADAVEGWDALVSQPLYLGLNGLLSVKETKKGVHGYVLTYFLLQVFPLLGLRRIPLPSLPINLALAHSPKTTPPRHRNNRFIHITSVMDGRLDCY